MIILDYVDVHLSTVVPNITITSMLVTQSTARHPDHYPRADDDGFV